MAIAITLFGGSLLGCGTDYVIRDYTVQPLPATDRLLGAIIRDGDQAWFYKLIGPIEQIDAVQPAFEQWASSTRFSKPGGPPTWTLPAGWQEQPGKEMRFKSIKITTVEPVLVASIIPLPVAGNDWDAYVLSNVNRWRRQMRLVDIGLSDLPGQLRTIDAGGHSVMLLELTGRAGGNAGPPAMATGGELAGAPPGPPQLKYETPEAWKQGESDAFSLLAFEVQKDGHAGRVTLTSAGGSVLDNVNRWRTQLGLSPVGPEQLSSLLQKVPMGDKEGLFAEVLAPEASAPREAILGIILEDAGRMWFLKLRGDAELAQAEKDTFLKFAKSLQIAAPQ